MTDYSVKPPQVEALGTALDAAASGIEDRLSALSRAAGTLAGQWLGEASTAYQGQQSGWLQEMGAHAGALHAAADAARTAAEAYSSADERVGALWSI
ncbi:WXG100 family type VII secretion target [Microbacterium sp. 3J1]|uniref:WXG100 family type VII secretion target n=1 Tax=Microbacterium sp. 3J1 TaxID=861269 RepID=UPI000B0347D7|nr:WXG100 family type VII secretion target [Microbacterium sp. 3J1]